MTGAQSARKTKRKRVGPYTEGQRNKVIDAIVEPLTKEDDAFPFDRRSASFP